MIREEEIKYASKDYVNYLLDKQEYHNENYTEYDIRQAFEKGAKWADNHSINVWHDVSYMLKLIRGFLYNKIKVGMIHLNSVRRYFRFNLGNNM